MHGVETEIKLPMTGPAAARRMLEAAGFQETGQRALEVNDLYDWSDGRLRASGCMVRVRTWGAVATLTYKGPADRTGGHKSREEVETRIEDAGRMKAVLERLGMTRTLRMEKHRTLYGRPGEAGIASLDETPVGVFVELEGSPEWIDRTAAEMGFSRQNYVLESYGSLYATRHITTD